MSFGPFALEFRKWIPPTWINDPVIGALAEVFGSALDGLAERSFRGRLAAIPYAGGAKTAGGVLLQCDPDVFPWHARDRQIKLYSTEPEYSKRVGLATWHQLHSRRGTHKGEIENVRRYFRGTDNRGSIPTIRIVHRSGDGVTTWHTYTGAGVYSKSKAVDNFEYRTGYDAQWAQWYAFVEMSESDFTGPPLYGDGHRYGGGTLYGADGATPFTVAAQRDIVAMFRDWKAAHSWLTAVILNWGPLIDVTALPTQDADGRWSLPNGTWGWTADPNTGQPTRPKGMQWVYEQLPP